MTVIDDQTPIDKKEEPQQPVDLTQVHQHTMHQLDDELQSDDEDLKDDPNQEGKDDNDSGTDDPVGDDDSGTGSGGDEKPEDPVVADDVPVVKPEPQVIPDTPLDTDITKQVDGKIAIKDSEGNTFYFNNIDEVPDDFEPINYKEAARMGQEFALKAQKDQQSAEEARIAKAREDNQKEIDAVTASWDKDIEVLTKGGVLPADEKDRETLIGDTYAYISKKLSDGVVIDSFAEAHKAMMFDRQQEAKAAKKEEDAKTKKAQGSMVMSGSPASSTKTRVIQAPPAGVGLDAVHAHHSGLLQK